MVVGSHNFPETDGGLARETAGPKAQKCDHGVSARARRLEQRMSEMTGAVYGRDDGNSKRAGCREQRMSGMTSPTAQKGDDAG